LVEPRRVAVVTGGASGIGLGIVRHLAGGGMAVVAADRDDGACAAARRALASFGNGIRVVTADIGTPEGAQQAIEAAIGEFGRIDLLCNNAAVHPMEEIAEHRLDTWREALRINLDGTMLCSQQAIPHMKRQGGGAIVNIGSVSGHAPYVGGGAYAVSKAAIAMLTRVLALEAGPYGIRVNCIAPGSIQHRPAQLENPSPPNGIPIGRHGTLADVAHLVGYLASDAAGYMNGAVITLDGGATAGRVRTTKRKPSA
jgi:NAD(P)-dependent dehydrogenase (short-subunit alcohol dehydrogenase family)